MIVQTNISVIKITFIPKLIKKDEKLTCYLQQTLLILSRIQPFVKRWSIKL